MEFVLYILFLIINIFLTTFILFVKNKECSSAKIRLTYVSGIITVAATFLYSIFFRNEEPLVPELIRTLSILSVTAIGIMLLGVFIKDLLGVEIYQDKRIKKNHPKVLINILMVAIASRLVLYFIGYLYAVQTLNQHSGFVECFDSLWNKWDSLHYLNIAQNGYNSTGENARLIVFYPLYPLLVSILSKIVKNSLLASVIVSDLSLGVGCYYLYKLVQIDFDNSTAMRSIKYLLIYPMSVFFGIAYTESIFIALSIMTLYYLRKEKWFAAGLCGFFAALTKNQGIILFAPAVLEYIISNRVYQKLRDRKFMNILKDFISKGIYVFLIPLGFFVYLSINKVIYGSWNKFLVYQKEGWENEFGNMFNNLKRIAESAINPEDIFRVTYWIPCIISFLLVVFLIFYSIGRMRLSYSVYMLLFMIVSFSPSWLLSGSRYISSLVPIYIGISVFTKRKWLDMVVTYTSILLLGFYTLEFLRGMLL
ncbi:glycosyltransferase family 39 protein [Acetivibrio cellulolyticus]|uniref:glycosyltransferase family 39 protein n=1 Tax=Acetivibrio cellulolyticus TaxID=35830 RepID=UPI0001E2C2DA|nr:glycosyltransferase family 39 protein [Acetivibrio cellulolyticus]